jgi:hypothetical protein
MYKDGANILKSQDQSTKTLNNNLTVVNTQMVYYTNVNTEVERASEVTSSAITSVTNGTGMLL